MVQVTEGFVWYKPQSSIAGTFIRRCVSFSGGFLWCKRKCTQLSRVRIVKGFRRFMTSVRSVVVGPDGTGLSLVQISEGFRWYILQRAIVGAYCRELSLVNMVEGYRWYILQRAIVGKYCRGLSLVHIAEGYLVHITEGYRCFMMQTAIVGTYCRGLSLVHIATAIVGTQTATVGTHSNGYRWYVLQTVIRGVLSRVNKAIICAKTTAESHWRKYEYC